MTRHVLKCHAENFDAIVSGAKRHEVRHEDDRKFFAGDVLALVRTDVDGNVTQPPKFCEVEVLHVARKAGPLTLFGVDLSNGGRDGELLSLVVMSIRAYKAPPAVLPMVQRVDP